MSGRVKGILKRVLHRAYDVPGVAALLPRRVWERSDVLHPVLRLLRDRGLGGVRVAENASPRVLFLRMRFVPRLGMTELVLAKQLADDGAEPVFAYCSPILPACNGWDIRSERSREVCERCHRNNRALAEFSPFRSLFLEGYVTDADVAEARARSAGIAIDDLKALTIDGVDLGNEMYLSMAKYLFCGTVPSTEENLRLAQGFAQAATILVKGLGRLFDEVRPDVVVMNAGHVMWYGIAYHMLRHRGIRAVTFDETNIAVTHLTWNFDDRSPSVDYAWDAEWALRRDVPLTLDEEHAIDALLEDRRGRYLYETATDTLDPAGVFDLTRFLRVLTLFTNVPWDATIVGKDIVFDSMLDWVKASIETVERHTDCALVIRVHPAEAGVYGMVSRERISAMLSEWRTELPANVFMVDAEDRVNSYGLIEASDGVLVYCSNVGLEALLMGKPVILSGYAHYRGKGLTTDVATTDEYTKLLERWCSEGPATPDGSLAGRYAYLAYIDTQIDLGLFCETHPHRVDDVTVGDLGAVLEGEDGRVFAALSEWIRGSGEASTGPFTNRTHLGSDAR